MAVNKREFKKDADALGASVIEEMIHYYYNVEGVDKDKIAKGMETVLGAVAKAKNNANVFFDRGARSFESLEDYSKAKRAFFRQLFKKIENEFDAEVNEGIKLFNEAIPENVRIQNKAIAAE